MERDSNNTHYQPLQGSLHVLERKRFVSSKEATDASPDASINAIDMSPSLETSPTPFINDDAEHSSHFDLSSESASGGSNGTSGLGVKKTVSFWVRTNRTYCCTQCVSLASVVLWVLVVTGTLEGSGCGDGNLDATNSSSSSVDSHF